MLDDNPSYTALLRELLLSAYGGACNQAYESPEIDESGNLRALRALISIPLGIFFMWDEQKKQHYPHHPHLKDQNAMVFAAGCVIRGFPSCGNDNFRLVLRRDAARRANCRSPESHRTIQDGMRVDWIPGGRSSR